MLVYVESYFGDRIISGKKCSEKKLREKFKQAFSINQAEDFTPIFCRMFKFEEIPFDQHIQVDFIIDLDTALVYAPKY